MESPLSSGGEGWSAQVWEYFPFLWRGEGSPFCVPGLWGSSNSKLEEAEPGFEGRCRVKERRIPRGLLGDLYCVIPRLARPPGDIYCGNVWQPSPLLHSGHSWPALLPCSGRIHPLKGPPRASSWAQRGQELRRGREATDEREGESRASVSVCASCCGIQLISGNGS